MNEINYNLISLSDNNYVHLILELFPLVQRPMMSSLSYLKNIYFKHRYIR